MAKTYDSASDDDSHQRLTSSELSRYLDDDVLEDEEEQERLLLEAQAQSSTGIGHRLGGKRQREKPQRSTLNGSRRTLRRKVSFDSDEDQELMYDAQQADRQHEAESRVRSSFSESPSAWNREKMGVTPTRKTSLKTSILQYTLILALIVTLFIAIAYGAYRASRKPPSTQTYVSNGTCLFAPTTILISLDGFRADFLKRGLTPALNTFVRTGVSPRYMTPSFPSVTFPNHFTLVTGLYPESHGVVGNSFWAPEYLETFYYQDRAHSMQPKWWSGEPLWETAELQDVPSAIHMWPGSEAHIGDIEPTYVDVFNRSELLSAKVDRILGLLDLPGARDENYRASKPRPQLVAAYVPDVDSDGHRFGPNSTEIQDTIRKVDSMIASLLLGIDQRNLTGIVNIVVVSDHGMASTSTDRLIQLENLVDLDLFEHMDGWPHYGLRPKSHVDLQEVYHALALQAQAMDGFDVYLRDENMPERYHFSRNDRIAPLWIMPRTGWAIVTKEEMDVAAALEHGDVYHPRGIHGYDNEDPLMRSIFMAQGPAFPHTPGSELRVFQNIEVYNIVCDSLGIEPKPNNGTLRLPLVPIGLHSDTPEVLDDLTDPTPDKIQVIRPSRGPGISLAETVHKSTVGSMTQTPTHPIASLPTIVNTFEPLPSRPVVSDGNNRTQSGEDQISSADRWWGWVEDHYKDFGDWLKGLVDKPGYNETTHPIENS